MIKPLLPGVLLWVFRNPRDGSNDTAKHRFPDPKLEELDSCLTSRASAPAPFPFLSFGKHLQHNFHADRYVQDIVASTYRTFGISCSSSPRVRHSCPRQSFPLFTPLPSCCCTITISLLHNLFICLLLRLSYPLVGVVTGAF
jgi:hypothetical protein